MKTKLDQINIQDINSNQEPSFDLRLFVFKYILRYWYLYILFIGAGFFSSWIYLRYAIPEYQASMSILIKGVGKNKELSEQMILSELGLSEPNSNVENEIQLLKSRRLMDIVVQELDLEVQVLAKGRVKESENYKQGPMVIDSFLAGSQKYGSIPFKFINDYTQPCTRI